jgi:membrane protein YdbS with pleckstrin-like domain
MVDQRRGLSKLDNMSDNKNASGGASFSGLLLLAFIVLKLCNVIHWSWLWVLSPFWIPVSICMVLLLVIGVFRFLEWRKDKQIVTRQGELKSKWQERIDQMKEAQAKMDELKAQRNA